MSSKSPTTANQSEASSETAANYGVATTDELKRSPLTDIGIANEGQNSLATKSRWNKRYVFRFLVFMLMGMCNLLPWNAILNAIPAMQAAAKSEGIPLTVTAAYCSALLIVTCCCLVLNLTKRWALHLALGLTMIASLCFAIGVQFGTATSSPILFHIIGVTLGGATSMYGCSVFGFAGLFPENFSAAASTGLGVAGVYTFCWWMLGKYLFFPGDDNTRATWLLISLVLAVMIVTAVVTVALFKTKEGIRVLEDFTESKEIDIHGQGVNESTAEPTVAIKPTASTSTTDSGLIAVIKQAWVPASCYGLTMFITLLCFPGLGPQSWEVASVDHDIIIGLFQGFDLVGRYSSVFFPSLELSTSGVVILSICRLIFICTFILSAAFTQTAVLGDMWFHSIHMCIMAMTNGWACTCCSQLIPRTVSLSRDIARASAFGLVCCYVGIVSGQWVAVPIGNAFANS